MRRTFLLALVVLLSPNAVLRAQSTNASVSGRVIDATRGVLVDVSIVAIRADTNARYQATTNAAGDYNLTNLMPGSYRIEVEKTGFKKLIKADITLHVQDALTLDFELPVGSVSDTVTVAAGAPLVNTASGVVSTVVDRTFVENLPLNGRSFQSLIAMTPGVVLTPASSTSPGQFSVNGQRSDANYFMVDGVSANVGVAVGTAIGVQGAGAVPGLSAQGGTNSLVSVDALQEFKVQSSSYAPEFGRMPGGQISILTRSGTNRFHGSLFEYFRDDALDSADYFVKRQGLSKPKEHQHDLGGVFGGPIQRNRTFVFVSYEHLRLEQPRSVVTEVPSIASRAAASDAVRSILAAFPVPNGAETSPGLARFAASYAEPSTLDATSVRVDRTFGGAVTVFGRYNYAPSDASTRLGSFAIASANTIGTLQSRLHTLTAGATWTIRPTLSNELRVNWSRNAATNFQTIDDVGGAIVLPSATLHPPFVPPDSAYQINLGAANVLYASGLNAANVQRQLNVVESLQLINGNHQLKFGIDYRQMFPIYGPLQYVQAYNFSGVAGLLGGTASSVQVIGFSTSNRLPRATNFAAYAQDAWSVTPRLTLTYGLRWDINPAPGVRGSNDALTLTTVNPASLAFAAPGTPMYRTRWGNVAPRVGVAYRVRGPADRQTALRGGWGLFYDLGSNSAIDNLGTSFPFVARRFLANVPFPVDPSLLTPPTITAGAPADFLVAPDPDLELPYTQQWNVAFEHQLGAAGTMSLSYVGAVGRRLLRQERLLNPTPQIQILTLVTNRGHSRYDALQMNVLAPALTRPPGASVLHARGVERQHIERRRSRVTYRVRGPRTGLGTVGLRCSAYAERRRNVCAADQAARAALERVRERVVDRCGVRGPLGASRQRSHRCSAVRRVCRGSARRHGWRCLVRRRFDSPRRTAHQPAGVRESAYGRQRQSPAPGDARTQCTARVRDEPVRRRGQPAAPAWPSSAAAGASRSVQRVRSGQLRTADEHAQQRAVRSADTDAGIQPWRRRCRRWLQPDLSGGRATLAATRSPTPVLIYARTAGDKMPFVPRVRGKCTAPALRIGVLSCALAAWCAEALALNPALDVSQYAHAAWRVRDGFVNGAAIQSMAQTAEGVPLGGNRSRPVPVRWRQGSSLAASRWPATSFASDHEPASRV